MLSQHKYLNERECYILHSLNLADSAGAKVIPGLQENILNYLNYLNDTADMNGCCNS